LFETGNDSWGVFLKKIFEYFFFIFLKEFLNEKSPPDSSNREEKVDGNY